MEIPHGKKIKAIIVQLLITREIPLCHMESCYKNISKIYNVTMIIQN